MGTSHNPQQFVKKINDLATATERKQADILKEGALATKAIFLSTAAARGMAPGSNIAGKRWSVRYDMVPGAASTAIVRFTGPFHLVEGPTKPHVITPKAGRRKSKGRSTGASVLRIGDDFRRSANHPGTRGKHIFKAAKVIAGDRVQRVMAARMSSVWSQAFR